MSYKKRTSIITVPSLLFSLFTIAATYLLFSGFFYLFVSIIWFIEDSDFLYYLFAFLFELSDIVYAVLIFMCCAASSFISFRIVVFILNLINKISDHTRKIVYIMSGIIIVFLNFFNLTYIIFDSLASCTYYHISELFDALLDSFGDYDGAFFQNFLLSMTGVAFIAKSHSFHVVNEK